MSCDRLIEALAGYIETDKFGTVTYYNHLGDKHRTDGPAVIFSNGAELWYQHGRCHRTDGPAVTRANGDIAWYQDGKLHRTDGPAIIGENGTECWALYGQLMTKTRFKEQIESGFYHDL